MKNRFYQLLKSAPVKSAALLGLLLLEATLQGKPEIIPPYLTGTGSLDP